jgi:hypothetical protein
MTVNLLEVVTRFIKSSQERNNSWQQGLPVVSHNDRDTYEDWLGSTFTWRVIA